MEDYAEIGDWEPPGFAASDPRPYRYLITSEHRVRPLFMAVVEALTGPLADGQRALLAVPAAYDLDAAAGVQLDAVGEWVGISRRLGVPLTGVYFSWDAAPSLGWDSGLWQGPFDPDDGIVDLGDEDYRALLRAKIAANSWDGTLSGAEAIWAIVFGGAQRIVLQDNQDMTMTIGFVGPPLNAAQQALLVGGYFPLKPSGVRIRYYAVPANDGPLFAWDADSDQLKGWDVGGWANEIIPE